MRKRILAQKELRRKRRAAGQALTHLVLMGLATVGVASVIIAPGLAEVARLLPREQRYGRGLEQVMRTLYRRGYITLSGSHGARKAQLTDAGRRIAHLYSIQRKKPDRRTWDQGWFMVSFDIPKEQRKSRDAFRHKLKELGFAQYHKSLYIHPSDYSSELDFLTDYYGVSSNVLYFFAADIQEHSRLKKLFGL
ncbi:MAG: hypothetical protein AAB955_03900 [Patescibacteria group bacterium]